MKAESFIDIQEEDDYKKADLKTKQQFVGKLMYLLYDIRLDITYMIGQLSKHNFDSRIGHFKVTKQLICFFKTIIHLEIKFGNTLKSDE